MQHDWFGIFLNTDVAENVGLDSLVLDFRDHVVPY